MILALSPPMVLSLLALRGERLTRRHWCAWGWRWRASICWWGQAAL